MFYYDRMTDDDNAENNLCYVCGKEPVERETDTLCKDCKEELYKKFCNFINSLTDEEVDTLDDWLDATSIKDVKIL